MVVNSKLVATYKIVLNLEKMGARGGEVGI